MCVHVLEAVWVGGLVCVCVLVWVWVAVAPGVSVGDCVVVCVGVCV